MKVVVVAVGRARGLLGEAIAGYEKRAGRYFAFESHEVREETARGEADAERVMREEGNRLLARVPAGLEIVAMHREGNAWDSERISRHFADGALHASPGTAFLIGGAFGLSDEVLASARHLLSLSAFTLPHELARLVLTEQIYRAGTIARGEPYHKKPRSGTAG
jgi:23S rRNA (pseudouridine1915-N3)-methyltransferase